MLHRVSLRCCCADDEGPVVTGNCVSWVSPKPAAFQYLITNVIKAFTSTVLPNISGVVTMGNCGHACSGKVILPIVTGYEDGKAVLAVGWVDNGIGGNSVQLLANAISSDDVPGGIGSSPCVNGSYDPNDSPVEWRGPMKLKPANFSGVNSLTATGGDTTYPYDFRSSTLMLTPIY